MEVRLSRASSLLPHGGGSGRETRGSGLGREQAGGFCADSRSPYGSYASDADLYFPVNARSARYHPKERVLGIEIGARFKAYPFAELARVESPWKDSFAGQDLVVMFDAETRSGEIRDASGKPLPSINAFWFAWYAFHPETEVFDP